MNRPLPASSSWVQEAPGAFQHGAYHSKGATPRYGAGDRIKLSLHQTIHLPGHRAPQGSVAKIRRFGIGFWFIRGLGLWKTRFNEISIPDFLIFVNDHS
jgi:hypothetical protein